MGSVLNRYLLDTNIIIDFLRGHDKAINFFNSIGNEIDLFISTITVTEIYAGLKSATEEELLNSFLTSIQIVPVDGYIAREGGWIKNKYGPTHGIGIADSIIAATALASDAKLITLNIKHFPMLQSKEAPY